MIHSSKERTNERKAAITAGMALVIMALAAVFSYGYVHATLVVQGDTSATFHNILASEKLFAAEILGWFIILICDIVVAWALYIYLRPIHARLSLFGAWLRLAYAAILGAAVLQLILVWLLLNGTDDSLLLKTHRNQAQVMQYLKAFESVWSIGLIIFGVHLLLVGRLAFQSDSIPKVVSILVLIAAVGYIAIHLGNTLFTQLDELVTILKLIFTVPMSAGELGFGLWLLVRGQKVSKKGVTPV